MKKVLVVMPQIGQSAAEGTIVRWHKQIGEEVRADELLVEVESDKISFEVESPASGRLTASLKEGMTVPVGETIATLETADDAVTAQGDPGPATTAPARPHLGADARAELVSTCDAGAPSRSTSLPEVTSDWLSPGVLRIAMQNGISAADLKKIRGSGRNGRVRRSDLMNFIARREAAPVQQEPAPTGTLESDKVIAMTSIRRTIADHMVQSIRTSAHVTMVHAVDMTGVVALRDRIKDTFLAKVGVRISYTSMVLHVVARILRQFPMINASVVGTNIVLRNEVSIGCAVALPDESLVVPVVRNADRKSFVEVAKDLERLIRLARDKALRRDDIDGGTFTISNFGAFGSLMGTPIINQPQVAILGMGAIFEAPVVRAGKIEVRNITYLNLSFDHRVIDGAMGGRFLNSIQKALESLDAEALGVSAIS